MARQRRTLPILLLEDTEHLGHVGEVVEVKPGYARNFLFPSGTACPVTKEAMHHVERAKQRAVETRRKKDAQLADQAEQLEGLSLTLEQRASEEGHLFGSVGAVQRADPPGQEDDRGDPRLGRRAVRLVDKFLAPRPPLHDRLCADFPPTFHFFRPCHP
jgi:large subunit ribosomal protein L9